MSGTGLQAFEFINEHTAEKFMIMAKDMDTAFRMACAVGLRDWEVFDVRLVKERIYIQETEEKRCR